MGKCDFQVKGGCADDGNAYFWLSHVSLLSGIELCTMHYIQYITELFSVATVAHQVSEIVAKADDEPECEPEPLRTEYPCDVFNPDDCVMDGYATFKLKVADADYSKNLCAYHLWTESHRHLQTWLVGVQAAHAVVMAEVREVLTKMIGHTPQGQQAIENIIDLANESWDNALKSG